MVIIISFFIVSSVFAINNNLWNAQKMEIQYVDSIVKNKKFLYDEDSIILYEGTYDENSIILYKEPYDESIIDLYGESNESNDEINYLPKEQMER